MSVVTETTARSEEKFRVTRSRRNVAWTGGGALIVVVVLALVPYLVGAGVWTIMVQAFIVLTLASMWTLLAGYAGLVSVPVVGASWEYMPYAMPASATVPNAMAAAMPNTCR